DMREEKRKLSFEVPRLLQERREQLGMSLADIEVATKIRGKFLAALEAGDYAVLPNDIYARGFVQKYADHLGLRGSDIAAQYVAERGGSVEVPQTRAPRLAKPPKFV